MFHNSQLSNSHSFTRDLEIYFGVSSYTNHLAEFLLLEIGLELAILRLSSISDALGLVKLVEANVHDTQHVLLKSTHPFSITHNSQFSNCPHLLHLLNTHTSLHLLFLFTASPLLKYRSDRFNLLQKLKFYGSIYGHHVIVLVDTGSSHNILQPHIPNNLNLSISQTPQFLDM
ncbi:hypothetical protein Lal_00037567 [Lupinus albus]|nr:hypothetical protein Lal_00037567 [Lupinus albus]